MADFNSTTDCLETIAKLLLRCLALGVLVLFGWFGAYLLMPTIIHQQGAWFGLTEHEIGLIHYCGMAFFKLHVLVLFAIPYIAIRLVLSQRKAVGRGQ